MNEMKKCSPFKKDKSQPESVTDEYKLEEDEDDYMSDKFITSLCDQPPGLSTARSVQRQRVTEVNSKKGRTLSRAEEEAKRRTEGLQKQVDPTNKGFNMLVKMGYAPGQGLGKNAEGRSEPVPIEVRSDRSGLGRGMAVRESREIFQRIRQQMMLAERSQFQGVMSTKFRLSRAKRQLEAARRICFQLDSAQSIPVPVSSSFWPIPEIQNPLSPEREPVRRYRSDHRTSGSHHSQDDRDRSPFYDDRDQLPQLSDEEQDLTSLNADNPRTVDANILSVLQDLVVYLRDRHSYCFWCSAQYADRDELNKECPGPSEEDHE
ncbi:Coiled-coil domain-containing protein 75 [Fasciola hepatica]|uniref:G patch domain-containing protein 11 n=1 Tax=Fasciola hepatica TaxID=6192 RepID=A0A4E0RNE5_FASHE|nr:Coiled-coil domain-containing protein 75 [Fasciola hepatica]